MAWLQFANPERSEVIALDLIQKLILQKQRKSVGIDLPFCISQKIINGNSLER